MTSAIVFVVDRLGAGFLGPYGNTWLPTLHFNRLAARSLICDTALTDSPDLIEAYRSLWTGRHVLEPAADPAWALPARAASAGAQSLLVTDEKSVVEHPLAERFEHKVMLQPTISQAPAVEIEGTGLFHLTLAAVEAISEVEGPLLAWVHARGMAGPWDAPREFRERMADPEDPSPPDCLAPPERRLAATVDPDEILGLVQAYAAQVQIVDECLELLMDAISRRVDADDLLLAVTSPRGYPLGEHGRVGPCDSALYSELLQVPLFVQLPRGEGRLARLPGITQTRDLYATIVEACGWGELTGAERAASLLREVRGEKGASRTSAVVAAPGQRAIRTPAWFLRESREQTGVDGDSGSGLRSHSDGGLRYELFAKPDDRWEANEVASRCPEEADLLAAELDRFEEAARSGRLAELAPPVELLCEVWR